MFFLLFFLFFLCLLFYKKELYEIKKKTTPTLESSCFLNELRIMKQSQNSPVCWCFICLLFQNNYCLNRFFAFYS